MYVLTTRLPMAEHQAAKTGARVATGISINTWVRDVLTRHCEQVGLLPPGYRVGLDPRHDELAKYLAQAATAAAEPVPAGEALPADPPPIAEAATDAPAAA